nr:immunoglobulin heavy chain junction region [Mus musculus]
CARATNWDVGNYW